jgi:hypothetical protein
VPRYLGRRLASADFRATASSGSLQGPTHPSTRTLRDEAAQRRLFQTLRIMSAKHSPNHIPAEERVTNTLFSILLLAYGTYGIWVNDLYIPGRRSRGIHLQDVPAWVMYGAFICACLVMLSVVVDHYDRRNNETNYKKFADTFRGLGWSFFVLSLILAIIR